MNNFKGREFKGEEWGEIMKEGGMKYVVFRRKEEDGLWMLESERSWF